MNSSPDQDKLVLHILHGLGFEYNGLAEAILPCDTSITFDELHQNFVTGEAQLQPQSSVSSSPFQPITANLASQNPFTIRPNHPLSSGFRTNYIPQQRPFSNNF
ncbi:unnamed protein product [Fraxinus pennsylvanica]|uniref:Uncharacterized protein n=1 Tax=Fraxinus pennsylvanica TaxID=56036 RepID=A0AAD2AAQ3_9LAMI|nr:unnamed protein product [Fraxinus pennsylvanica]